jgi:hypothetical protein
MLTEKFDAYGEVLPDPSRDRPEAAKATPVVLSRIGQSVFWLLVAIIISARIIFYPASPASEFRSASQPSHAATR